jgi:hypothetical protein
LPEFAYSADSPGPRSRTWLVEFMRLNRALARPEKVGDVGVEPIGTATQRNATCFTGRCVDHHPIVAGPGIEPDTLTL